MLFDKWSTINISNSGALNGGVIGCGPYEYRIDKLQINSLSPNIEPELSFDFAGKTYHDRALFDFIQKHTQKPEDRKDDKSMTNKTTDSRKTIPHPIRIAQYNTATVVHWDDGTYTSVNHSSHFAGEENIYAAFTAALAKKLYGSTSAVHKLVDRNNAEVLDRKAEEEKQARQKAQAEAEQRNHDRKVRAMAKEMKMKAEAKALALKEVL